MGHTAKKLLNEECVLSENGMRVDLSSLRGLNDYKVVSNFLSRKLE